ncbi:AAA family ATPase [Sphaerisporangium sp. NPDC049002]|uniref:helix-turn-helix transcriptional regulator n=1 Tax=Sphaerisporangium sp. NPDC049002 TaxID=3155392 RepID=UPI0033CB0E58
MRGREPEWHTFIHLLRAAGDGRGGTLLVEGEPGTGKSLLLAEAAAHASRQGFLPVTGGSEELEEVIPLAPLFMALDEPPAHASRNEELDPRVQVVEQLRVRLKSCTATCPVLVGLDDLQWADPATLAALRTLHWELIAEPVVWLLARRTVTGPSPALSLPGPSRTRGASWTPEASRTPGASQTPGALWTPGASQTPGALWTPGSRRTSGPGTARDDEAERLFRCLEKHGAIRVELGPLPDDIVAEVAADVLGAVPQPDLLALAAGAGGNPFLLTELLSGLREEGSVEVAGGRTRLLSAKAPERVHALVRHLLDGLSRDTRQLVEAAAVLGRSFSPEDAAELVGTSPAALLPAFEEAMDAGILVTTQEALEFRHELVWQAVVAALHPPVRHALHHQIGKILLDRGGSPIRAAGHLIEGTRPGDARTLIGLDQAVAEVLACSPCAAADLAVQAVELSDLSDPSRFARVVTAIEATTEAGRLDDAGRLVRSALARPVSPQAAAELRCALSGLLFMNGRAAEAVAEARAALAEPGLPCHLRDRATLALLYGLAGLPDGRRAAEEAEAVLTAADRHGEAVVVGAMVVLATARWNSGRLADGLQLAREAVRRAQGGSVAVRRTHPRLALASMLTDIRRLDEAEIAVREAGEEVEALGHSAWASAPAVLRARAELVAGRLDDAVADAQDGLDLAGSLGTHLFSSLAASVLSTVALRRGDLRTAAQHVEADRDRLTRHAAQHVEADYDRLSPHAAPAAPGWCAMPAARVAEARDGPVEAMKLVGGLYPALREHCRVLVDDPACAPWLVRVALAAGDRASAVLAVTAAESLAGGNPGFRTVRAAATHARALLEGDAEALDLAAKEGTDAWARASAAEDLGVVLAASGDRQEAVRSLDQALAGYEETGSARDAARLRRRLRRMGVRHRHWATAERPISGWASLTDTECAVSLLVTQGWTNRQVADQMFISAHTVAFHLRQIFRKLGIASRVELTRLAVEQRRDLEHPSRAKGHG